MKSYYAVAGAVQQGFHLFKAMFLQRCSVIIA